ncbi:hypothetical protein HCN44_001237 [Aphidius gifuensis]|uniref:Leucine-rich repeat-containing protein n=1 Tax=Aphidius gifuensis TaxID=684658 RepID=A0A835CLD4_APHGI|nr:hypothetical protein HCN44_001237 [Aphidius gifuensis]
MSKKLKIKDKLEDEILDLSWCDLQEVPIREIAAIKKASHLDLSNNQLVSIPNTIVTLTNIIKLDLSKNMLTEIPENIGEMKQLKHLDLYGNQISRLPLSLGDLKNLKWLDLKENPLTPAVAKVAGTCSDPSECQHCARSIVSYLSLVKINIEQEKLMRSNNALSKQKKKKKKNTVKDEKQNTVLLNEKLNKSDTIKNDSLITSETNNHKKLSEVFNLIKSAILLTILLGFICILIAVILPKYDSNLSDRIINYLQLQTKLPVEKYHKLAIEKFAEIQKYLFIFFKKLQIYIEDIYKKYSTSD